MWIYNGEPVENVDLDNYIGFVYCIENLKTGKKYIGKKLLLHRKTRQVKGKKKRFLAESDWRDYWGSNKTLLNEIAEHGEDQFKRTILDWCKTKGEASYIELYHQMKNQVLLDDNYYNDIIQVRISGRHVKHVKKRDF